jgi:uncharacterized protein DUF6624
MIPSGIELIGLSVGTPTVSVGQDRNLESVVIPVSFGAFLFDGVGMTHAHTPLIALTAVSLLLASGCASSQTRSESDGPALSEEWTHEDSTEQVSEVNSSNYYDDLVIGTEFSEDFVPKYHGDISDYTMSEIQAELEDMYDLDGQLVRASFGENGHDESTVSTIRTIDQAHAARLKEIVEHVGWPTRNMVGLKATQAAYMVIQHAGDDSAFQNQCLALMVDLVEDGELPASYVALLTDRIRVFQGEPQVFGTQMAMASDEHGMLVPTPTVPIEDPEHLDDRRKLMGMPPHGEFASAIAIAYEASKVDAGNAFASVPTDE